MTVPVHARLRIGGLLYGDALWSIGLNFGYRAVPGPINDQLGDPFATLQGDVQGSLEEWADAVKAQQGGAIFPGALGALLSTRGVINTIRCSRIGTDGKETNVAQIQIAPAVPGTGSAFMPVQTALVGSLQTNRPGASYRGRVYLPALGAQTGSGALSSPTAANVAAGLGDLLHDCAVSLGAALTTTGMRPAVVSGVKNAMQEIVSVRVGDRLDSQRRRRGGEKETYSSSAVPQ